MILSYKQKLLILKILKKERRRLFSHTDFQLLDKTIKDIKQQINNHSVNELQ